MSTLITPTVRSSSVGLRLLCFGGVLVTLALIYLGGIWPSLFTLIAIPALPSPLLFLVAIFRPSLIRNHEYLRWYLVGCCIASVLSWLLEVWWLHHIQ